MMTTRFFMSGPLLDTDTILVFEPVEGEDVEEEPKKDDADPEC